MLLSSFFIIEAEGLVKLPVVTLPENACLIYRIAADKLADSTFYENVFRSQKQYPFLLLIDIRSASWQKDSSYKKHLNALVAYTFHYRYIKTGYGNPLIIFQTNEGVNTAEYITLVEKTLYNQGYDNWDPQILKNDQILSWPQKDKKGVLLNIQDTTGAINADYYEALKATKKPSQIFLMINTPEKFETILAGIKRTEDEFQVQLPHQYYLLQELSSMAHQHQQLLVQLGLLHEKLDSQARYNSFYRNADERYKKQILEIVDFYKNEYEILPLWFKQLGHVLKVVIGKRTFKSLFNDNVKKYKE